MIIRIVDFKGLAPRIAAAMLPPNAAQVANNCRFGSASLRPWLQPSFVVTPSKVGIKQSIYQYEHDKFFHWLEDVNISRSAVAADGFARVYWTGEGVPKLTVNSIATAGGSLYPTNSYTLGIPAPAAALTIALTGPPGTDPTLAGSRSYVYTYVSAYGEEGPPSAPSALATIYPGQSVTLNGMSTAPAGSYNIVTKNIYRTNTGSSTTEYQYVGSIAVAATTLSDTILSANLGEVLPSSNWIAPPSALKGLIAHPAGFMVGFYNNVLCFSAPYLPHAWPAAFQVVVDQPIVAIGAFGNSILVTTTGMPYLVTGGTPGAMSVEKLEKGEACLSKRGFVDMGYVCAYPGPSGLWLAGTGTVDLATAGIMKAEDWKKLSPESMLGTQYESAYLGFYNTGAVQGGIILDTATGDYSKLDVFATAAWYDRENGKLYLVVNGDIVQWCGGNTFYSLVWKSPPVQATVPTNLGAAQVQAVTYPLTFKVYADGVLKHTQTVINGKPFRLPGGFRATWWESEVTGTSEVTAILLASTMTELAQV